MMLRSQISLDAELHRKAKRRAAELGLSLAGYIRRLIAQDVPGGARPKGDMAGVIGLFDGGGSDIASHKHEYVGEAIEAEYLEDMASYRPSE